MQLQRTSWFWMAVGSAAALAIGAAFLPFADSVHAQTVALVLVVPVVVVAATGRRAAAFTTAVVAAATYDFWYTDPKGSFTIDKTEDLVLVLVLLVVGVVVTEVSIWGKRQRVTAERTISDVAILRSVAELLSLGEDEEIVAITASFWLRELLDLRDCRLDLSLEPASGAEIRPGGEVAVGNMLWATETQGLPGPEVDLFLHAGGKPVGRFVLTPTPGEPVLPDRLLTASALADLVGTWMGTEHRRRQAC